VEAVFRIHLVFGYAAWLLYFGTYAWPKLKATDGLEAQRAIVLALLALEPARRLRHLRRLWRFRDQRSLGSISPGRTRLSASVAGPNLRASRKSDRCRESCRFI
jgi:hypothetical protein